MSGVSALSAQMEREPTQFFRTREVSALQLKRSLYLFRGDLRARLEPDCSSSWVHSASAGKLLFGREATEVFRIQSGVRIPVRPQDVTVKLSPDSASFFRRGQERVHLSCSVRLVAGEGEGWARSVAVTNRGDSASRIRVITLHDPTSVNYRRDRDPPGEIGVNAFNRQDQVVMDDVGDTSGVRVVAFSPRPSVIYMTKDRARALEYLSHGELPESSLGMSGSVIVMAQHELDLAPGASAEIRTVSVYHRSSLEAALNAASRAEGPEAERGPDFSSSSPSLNFAFDWASAALHAMEGEPDLAERLWCGTGLAIVRPGYLEKMLESLKGEFVKDGTLPPLGQGVPRRPEGAGAVETSLYVIAASAHLIARSKDKKLVRRWYPRVKKAAEGLARLQRDGLVESPRNSAGGWRRLLEAGFPTGHTSEVNLIALRGLKDAAAAATIAGKVEDATRFREAAARLDEATDAKLKDSETGALVLNVDPRGVIHREVTLDQAVGLSFFPLERTLCASLVRRLAEKDFETGFGPRTVPTSNNLYYSATYGEGQLGGYWTRAALAHAILAYLSGLPGVGGSQLEKVARLIHLEAEALGGIPGEIPYWLDTERKLIKRHGTDPVASARLIEAVVSGEAGMALGAGGVRFSVPGAAQLNWLLLHGLKLSSRGSVFVGRSNGRAYVASSLPCDFDTSSAGHPPMVYPDCARTWTGAGVDVLTFWDPASTLVCLGNPGPSPFLGTVAVPLKSKSFARALFAKVEELQQESGQWAQSDRVKLLKQAELRTELKPGAWRMLRLSGAA